MAHINSYDNLFLFLFNISMYLKICILWKKKSRCFRLYALSFLLKSVVGWSGSFSFSFQVVHVTDVVFSQILGRLSNRRISRDFNFQIDCETNIQPCFCAIFSFCFKRKEKNKSLLNWSLWTKFRFLHLISLNVCYLFKWHSKQEVRMIKTLSCRLFAESAKNVTVELPSTIFLSFSCFVLKQNAIRKIKLKFDTFRNFSHIFWMEIGEAAKYFAHFKLSDETEHIFLCSLHFELRICCQTSI